MPCELSKIYKILQKSATPMVYPRTHGETFPRVVSVLTGQGLSPYIRGNHLISWCEKKILRSIPVHTGKPPTCAISGKVGQVYPRTYGETGKRFKKSRIIEGLSPYIRGNHAVPGENGDLVGSIPVHTGKPAKGAGRVHFVRVYPRTYGETSLMFQSRTCGPGLSPYIRGNPLWW